MSRKKALTRVEAFSIFDIIIQFKQGEKIVEKVVALEVVGHRPRDEAPSWN